MSSLKNFIGSLFSFSKKNKSRKQSKQSKKSNKSKSKKRVTKRNKSNRRYKMRGGSVPLVTPQPPIMTTSISP